MKIFEEATADIILKDAAVTTAAVSSASASPTGGQDSALIVESYTDGTHDVTVENDADDGAGNSAGTWAAVPADRLVGSIPSITGAGGPHYVGVLLDGDRPHLRVTITPSGATSGATFSGVAVFGDPDRPLR